MAKNKITHEWNEDGTAIIFTGSQRQPTLTEIHNYATDAIRKGTLPVLEGLYVTTCKFGGDWTPPEYARSVMLVEFGEDCPICHKKWYED